MRSALPMLSQPLRERVGAEGAVAAGVAGLYEKLRYDCRPLAASAGSALPASAVGEGAGAVPSPGTGGGAIGVPMAGAQHEGAGAAQVGAAVQHVAGADEQQLRRQQPQRASAVWEQTMNPAVQIMAAVANFNMISLLAIASRFAEVERQASGRNRLGQG